MRNYSVCDVKLKVTLPVTKRFSKSIPQAYYKVFDSTGAYFVDAFLAGGILDGELISSFIRRSKSSLFFLIRIKSPTAFRID